MLRGRVPAICVGSCLVGVWVFAFAVTAAEQLTTPQAECPNPPVVSISSSSMPTDVCIPLNFPSTANPIDFFDDFSWKSFVALVWPAQNGNSGRPDLQQEVDGKGPRVFETYKALWEVFHSDGSVPTPWNSFDNLNACSATTGFGDLLLASSSRHNAMLPFKLAIWMVAAD